MEADDLSLVRKARAGDDRAFQALVVRYQRKVYAVALGIVRDTDTAWDVAQEAFVRAHGHLAGLEGEEAFLKWLFRITSHLAIDSVQARAEVAQGRGGGRHRGRPAWAAARGSSRRRWGSTRRTTCSGASWRPG